MRLNKLFNNQYIRIDISKNAKLPYYLKNIVGFLLPTGFYQKQRPALLDVKKEDSAYIKSRVDYYNKLDTPFSLEEATTIKDFRKEKKKTYFFDLYRYLRYFDNKLKFTYLFGDITHIPKEPSFVKSRPITEANQNAVLLKLNHIRHFIFVDDKKAFEDKKSILLWRGKAHQKHRQEFLEKFYTHPLCDVGQIIKKKDKSSVKWQKPKMSLKEQLDYKFILAIEGNDVASNLKWVMSSNSLAFMTEPRYETWFMEGTLIPNHHYVLLKDDYSDLEEKIAYYSSHIEEAKAIIANAHTYVEQFKDQERENVIALKVIEKYFKYRRDS